MDRVASKTNANVFIATPSTIWDTNCMAIVLPLPSTQGEKKSEGICYKMPFHPAFGLPK